MKRSLEALAFTSLFFLWLLSVTSIPFIPERCCVCHEQEGANPAEELRTLSIIEWVFDVTPDLHWSCQGKYDAEIHNPNGGVK